MTSRPKGSLVLSILIITVGTGWLLTVQGVGAGINWVWTLGLAVIGVLAIVLSGGIDKFSVVAGPIFLASSALSVARQRGMISIDTELPVLVIGIGVLLLVAQSAWIPSPPWMVPTGSAPPR